MRPVSAEALVGSLGAWPHRVALLDIREAGEAAAAHIPGATFMPRRMIELRAARVLPDRSAPIVVYDGDDGRAPLAARTLEALGYNNVAWIEGGLSAWRAAGGRIDSGANVPPKRFGERVLHEDAVPTIDGGSIGGGPLWDVRTPAEYGEGTLPGSVSAPGFDMLLAAADSPGGPIQVHCAGRTRSIIAAQSLRLLGRDAIAVEDGAMGWMLAGKTLAYGATARLPRPGKRAVAAAETKARALAAAAAIPRVASNELPTSPRLIDVRAKADYGVGHVPGSEWIPGAQAVQRADDFFPLADAPLVLIDSGEARAIVTAYWLRRMGFVAVSVLAGGVDAWRASGRALERRRTSSSSARDLPLTMAETVLHEPVGHRINVDDSRAFIARRPVDARWMPRGWLELAIGRIASPPAPIVVFATEERQATLAASTLIGMGYDAKAVQGGIDAWRDVGGAIATGPSDEIAAFPPDMIELPYHAGLDGMRRYLDWEKAL